MHLAAPAAADHRAVPRHVGIVLDGNRRWARRHGHSDVTEGHRVGFGKIPEVLDWCSELGIGVVTLWMLSTENIANRSAAELTSLYEIDEKVIRGLTADRRWRLHPIGRLDLLPAPLTEALREAEQTTRNVQGTLVNLAVAHGGRDDLLTAVRALVRDALRTGDPAVDARRLETHLSTAGQPDVDLVIRPSGELRTSGFLLWQAATAELYFCDRLWPDFDRTDLLDAVHAYRRRHRRLGA